MLLLSSLPKVAPASDLGESMLLLMSLSQVAPTSDLGESMLLLSSLVAPSSERGEIVVVLLSLSLSLSLSLLLSLSLSLSLSFAVDAPSSAGRGLETRIRGTVVMHSSLFQRQERRRCLQSRVTHAHAGDQYISAACVTCPTGAL